jgi:GT2 family glycosyltransferase
MFSKANNIGIKNANGKYVLLLNSDTLIAKYELEKFKDLFFISNSYNWKAQT